MVSVNVNAKANVKVNMNRKTNYSLHVKVNVKENSEMTFDLMDSCTFAYFLKLNSFPDA